MVPAILVRLPFMKARHHLIFFMAVTRIFSFLRVQIVKQMWPYVEGYVVEMLRNTVEPAVRDNLPKALKNFRFEKISLGRYVSWFQ